MRKFISIVEGVVDFGAAKSKMRPNAPIMIDLSPYPDLFDELWTLIVENWDGKGDARREWLVSAMEEAKARGNRLLVPADLLDRVKWFIQDATELGGTSAAKRQGREVLRHLRDR